MKTLTKKLLLFIVSLFSLIGFSLAALAGSVQAVCPVCTAAVVAGLGLSRWLGVDDSVSGIWIGGGLLSSSLWFFSWIIKKYPRLDSKLYKYLTVILTYALIIIPLVWSGVIGHPFNKLWGIDRLIVGVGLGSAAFLFGVWADKKIRKIKGGQLFTYQKVVFPISALIITGVLLFFAVK